MKYVRPISLPEYIALLVCMGCSLATMAIFYSHTSQAGHSGLVQIVDSNKKNQGDFDKLTGRVLILEATVQRQSELLLQALDRNKLQDLLIDGLTEMQAEKPKVIEREVEREVFVCPNP